MQIENLLNINSYIGGYVYKSLIYKIPDLSGGQYVYLCEPSSTGRSLEL